MVKGGVAVNRHNVPMATIVIRAIKMFLEVKLHLKKDASSQGLHPQYALSVLLPIKQTIKQTYKQTNKTNKTNIFLKKRIKSLNYSALCRAMLWKGALLTLGMMSLTIVLQSQIHITTLHWTALMAESSCHYKKNLLSFHKFFFIMHKIFTIIFATCASEY